MEVRVHQNHFFTLQLKCDSFFRDPDTETDKSQHIRREVKDLAVWENVLDNSIDTLEKMMKRFVDDVNHQKYVQKLFDLNRLLTSPQIQTSIRYARRSCESSKHEKRKSNRCESTKWNYPGSQLRGTTILSPHFTSNLFRFLILVSSNKRLGRISSSI